jgi:hypothetical protein
MCRCTAPSAGTTSSSAAPTWLTRDWTASAGLASIALRRGAARCCTWQREDGSLAHHLAWQTGSSPCQAPPPAGCSGLADVQVPTCALAA